MKKNLNYLLVLIGLIGLVCPNTLSSQVKTSYNDIWFHYVGKNMLSEKTSFTFEATMRYADGLNEKQQWFIRPSFDYQFSKKFTGSIGYSHYNTYSYGNPALNKTSIPENHIWVQGTYTHFIKNVKLTHRLRDENRFVGIAVKDNNTNQYYIDHYDYRNRLRYMISCTIPVVKKDKNTLLFATIGDEAFLNIGSNAGATLFNQNRIIGGFGYNINKNNQIQLSYIQQHIWNYTNTIQEDNPTLRISYLTSFDWYSKK